MKDRNNQGAFGEVALPAAGAVRGRAIAPNWFVRCSAVQQLPMPYGGVAATSTLEIMAGQVGPVGPNGTFRFTQFACPANGGYHFDSSNQLAYANLLLQDCSLWNGMCAFDGGSNTVTTLRNNLFARPEWVHATGSGSQPVWLSLTNNLFWRGPSI